MQLTEIKNATIAQLRSFAADNQLLIEGDRRLRATYEKAISNFLTLKQASTELVQETIEGAIVCVNEAFTYDNAVLAANKLAVLNDRAGDALQKLTIATGKFVWSATLVTIAIVWMMLDKENRVGTKAAMLRLYDHVVESVGDRLDTWRHLGRTIVCLRVEYPVSIKKAELRDRFLNWRRSAI